jgi:hypothetical protein
VVRWCLGGGTIQQSSLATGTCFGPFVRLALVRCWLSGGGWGTSRGHCDGGEVVVIGVELVGARRWELFP